MCANVCRVAPLWSTKQNVRRCTASLFPADYPTLYSRPSVWDGLLLLMETAIRETVMIRGFLFEHLKFL